MRLKKQYIGKKDINMKEISVGDICAEGKVGEIIWQGCGKVIEKPFGIVYCVKASDARRNPTKNRVDGYNILQLGYGKVEILSSMPSLKYKTGQIINDFGLSTWDGNFYGWDSLEIIGHYNFQLAVNHYKLSFRKRLKEQLKMEKQPSRFIIRIKRILYSLQKAIMDIIVWANERPTKE